MMKWFMFKNVFKGLSSTETAFEEPDSRSISRTIIVQVITIIIFVFLIGVVMGSYHSFIQAISSGIKLCIAVFALLAICFPSFYVIQRVLGSKLTVAQMTQIILSGFVLSSTIVLSFTPIVLFFMLTSNDYHFLQLLHVAIFIFSGFWGTKSILDNLKYACDQKNIYPKTGVTVFKIWIVVLAFVGMQLTWNLRPFVGQKSEEFKVLRKYRGNFYTAIIYSFEHLGEGKDSTNTELANQPFNPETNSVDSSSLEIDSIEPLKPIDEE